MHTYIHTYPSAGLDLLCVSSWAVDEEEEEEGKVVLVVGGGGKEEEEDGAGAGLGVGACGMYVWMDG